MFAILIIARIVIPTVTIVTSSAPDAPVLDMFAQEERISIPVVMLDESVHTEENGYQCRDETCPCSLDATGAVSKVK